MPNGGAGFLCGVMCSLSGRGDAMLSFILYLHHETERAWLVSEKPNGERLWLPKSQCDEGKRSPGELGEPELIEIDIPEWLAKKIGVL